VGHRGKKRNPNPLGLSSDGPDGLAIEFTEKYRRGAGFFFPIAILMHLLFTHRVWPALALPSLTIATILVLVGLAFRYVRRALVVLAVGSVHLWFFFVYTLGITPTIGYLVLTNHRDWLPWAPLASAALLLTFLAYRVRLDLARDWSRPLDETPGVVVNRKEATLWREYGKTPQGGLCRAAIAIALVLAPAMYFTYGTPMYLLVMFVFAAPCIALLVTPVVAWWVAYYIAVVRWERANDIALRLPPLMPRSRAGH